MSVSRTTLVRQLRELGVPPSRPLMLHASLRRLGPVEGRRRRASRRALGGHGTGRHEADAGDYFSQILVDFIAGGHARVGAVAGCTGELFEGEPFVAFATAWMEDRFSRAEPA